MRGINIPVPSSQEESNYIAQRLDALDSKLRNEAHTVEKFAHQKSGLMHDLLTGKVQVKVDNPSQETKL